jgi:hypothetical protein
VVRSAVPTELASFRNATHFSILQIWFGNLSLHYEAWIRSRLKVLELGLHFEADPLTNARLLAAFRARDRAVRRALGEDTRIEPWDKGWARIWEPLELASIDATFLERVAARLAAYITALEPILRDELPADVAWAEPIPRSAQRAPTGVRAKARR